MKGLQRKEYLFKQISCISHSESGGIPHFKSQQVLAEHYLSPQAGIKLMVDGEMLSYSSHTSETITMAPRWTFA